MGIKKHEISTTGVGITDEEIYNAFAEIWKLTKLLDNLHSSCESFDNEEFDDDDLSDECETVRFLVPNFKRMVDAHASTLPRVDRYGKEILLQLDFLRDTMKESQAIFFADGTTQLKSRIKSTIGYLSYWLYHEFSIEDTEDVDSIVRLYINANPGITIELIRDKIQNWMEKYGVPVSIFDAIPELENEFWAIMGPDAAEIDEKFITAEDVADLVAGKISPSDVLQRVDARAGSELDTANAF